ncbi:unnamed protein product, partial [Prorocentrum cordatum]
KLSAAEGSPPAGGRTSCATEEGGGAGARPMEGRAPYPYHRKKAVQHGEAMRIRQVKDKLANVRRDIKEKRLRREEVDFEAVLAGCPEFKLGCDPMEFSEIGSPPPRDRIAMCALLFLGLVQLRSSLRLRV